MAWGDQDGGSKGPWGQNPWGGKPSGGGNNNPPPPDIDELLRKTQEKLQKMFGGNDGGDNNSSSMKGFALVGAVVLGLWFTMGGFYTVQSDEEGVVLRFGKYHRTEAPGLRYHWPYPFESVMTPKVTAINRVEIGMRSSGKNSYGESTMNERLMLTGDENIVDINFEVQWEIQDAVKYLFNVRDPESTVRAVAESAMREVIGRTKIAVALAEGKQEIASQTKELLQKILDEYDAGIHIKNVNLLDTDPPAQVIDAFRDVQTARADLETARNQAEAYRNDIIPRARGEGEKLVLDAEAYKQEVIARAQGEASRFSAIYNEYKGAKNVTQKRMYLETMEEVLGGMNKIVIDNAGGQGVLPYLPLSELKSKPKAEDAP